jgi:hypothetical protein
MNNNEGEWITVTNKKNRRNKNKNSTFDKTKVKLWYTTSSWQHKVLNNSYKYEDGSTVLDKFNLAELHDRYLLAKSNYDKNYFCKKLMRVVTEDKWKIEQSLVYDIDEDVKGTEPVTLEEAVALEKKAEPIQERQVEVEQPVKSVETSVVNTLETSKCKEGISWASIV